MIVHNLKISFNLSIAATILAAIASGIGIFNTKIYYDNDFVKSAWYANVWVKLVGIFILLKNVKRLPQTSTALNMQQ